MDINTVGYRIQMFDNGKWSDVQLEKGYNGVPRHYGEIMQAPLALSSTVSYDSAMAIAYQAMAKCPNLKLRMVSYDLHIKMDAYKGETMEIKYEFQPDISND